MMKKVQKLLTLGLCLALGAGALVACDKDKGGSGDGYAEGDLTNYWMAGRIKDVDGWDEKDADNNNLVADAVRFVRSAESGVYTLTLDLWKDDQFKIRYLGRGWDDEGGQLNASNNFDEENNGDTTNGLAGESGDGLGGKNFECYKEGNYTVTIDTNSDTPMVTWVRNGDATVKAPILATDVTLKDADEQVVSSITLRVGDTLQLSATVAPDNTTNKAVTYSSSNTDCFTVSATGLVTAVAVPEDDEEELELYVNVGSQIALKTVSVTILAAGTEIVQPESIAIPVGEKEQKKHVGDTITVNPTILPADTTNKAVAYSMTDTSGAITISGTTITAVKPTTAPITITATVGSGANAKTDTFTVEVVKDYYLRGIGSWDATTTVGDSTYVFLTETSAGIYTATDVTIAKNAEFMITHVGTVTGSMDWEDGRIDNTALDSATTTAGKIIAKAGGGNIQCTDTAKYTITLNLTGANPVVSAELTQDLPDDIATADGFGVWGDAVSGTGWSGPAAADKVTLQKGQDGKWTGTVSGVELVGSGQFQFRLEVDGATKYIDNRVNPSADGKLDNFDAVEGIASAYTEGADGNYTNSAEGTYSFTITLTAAGDVESIVAVKTA